MSEEWDMEKMNQQVTEEFRANGGKVGGPFEGANLLILHTTGAKSGKRHDNPLLYRQEDDGRTFVFASMAGAPRNPGWYYNLKANPIVEVEMGDAKISATARELQEPERSEIYARQAAETPQFAEYQQSAGSRVIPVVEIDTDPTE